MLSQNFLVLSAFDNFSKLKFFKKFRHATNSNFLKNPDFQSFFKKFKFFFKKIKIFKKYLDLGLHALRKAVGKPQFYLFHKPEACVLF